MTYWDVYIGGLDDPDFSWGSEAQEGEPPKRLSPFFPSTGRGGPAGARGFPRAYPGGVFGELVGAIQEGRFEGSVRIARKGPGRAAARSADNHGQQKKYAASCARFGSGARGIPDLGDRERRRARVRVP